MALKTLLLLSFLLVPFSLVNAQSTTKAEAQNAIQNAGQVWEQAKASGHEWNTIEPLVSQAKQALKTQKYTTALALANQASQQAKLALKQAEHEKTNWVNNVPN